MTHPFQSEQNRPIEVPEVVILRLPQYIRILNQLNHDGIEVVSSHQLGQKLQVTPAQIRKDLSYFGRFGKQGRGYNVPNLMAELKQILKLDKHWNVCLVGVGRLGRAILSYPGLAPEGFHIVAAFDSDPQVLGSNIGDVRIYSMEELRSVVRAHNISVGVVAVPAQFAQQVVDQLVACKIKAVLNYAPITPQVPSDVKVRNIDPVLALQSMTYYLPHD